MIKKVLIVEDSFEVRMALETAFSEEGYSVVAARNGVEGLEEFKSFSPDLALLDVRMPGMSGLDLCARIRETSNIPVIIFSAVEESAEKIEALMRGADDYVVKGTGVDELLARATAQLRWDRRPQREDEEDGETGAEDAKLEVLFTDNRPGESNQRPTVLIVDADADLRRRQKIALERAGYRVLQNSNGRDAVITVAGRVVDLLIIDALTPVMDGFKVIKLLRTWERTRDLPVLMLSTNASPQQSRRASTFGVSDFIPKPIADGEIVLRAKWALDREARRRERVQATQAS